MAFLTKLSKISPLARVCLSRCMSHVPENTVYGVPTPQTADRRVTLNQLKQKYKKVEPIAVVTAYDYPSAVHLDITGIDICLIGDSASMVVHGHDTTLPISLEEMLVHCRAVARGAKRPLLVGDLPFGTYETSTIDTAVKVLREGGMDAIKLGGSPSRITAAKAIVEAGIAVIGHVGLTPQAISVLGRFRPQGKNVSSAIKVVETAMALQEAGCFSVVSECVPAPVAAAATSALRIPTIGIGAGPFCIGQVLVYHDLLGMLQHPHHAKVTPKFCKQYACVGDVIKKALSEYKEEVNNGLFPGPSHTPYKMNPDDVNGFFKELEKLGLNKAASAATAAAEKMNTAQRPDTETSQKHLMVEKWLLYENQRSSSAPPRKPTPTVVLLLTPAISPLLSSSSPSPLFLYKITRGLGSSSLALNFFKHLQQNTPSQHTHFLSHPFQAPLEQVNRELDGGSRLSELYQASKEWGIPLTVNAAAILIRGFGRHKMVDESVILFKELDPSVKNTHVRNVFIDYLLRNGHVKYALNVLEEMLEPLSEVPPDEITGYIIFSELLKGDRKGERNLSQEDTINLVFKLGKHGVFPKDNLAYPIWFLGRNGDIKRMHTLVADMKENDIQPSAVTSVILINQLSDGIIYNTVIDGLCKVGRQEEGLRLMYRMRSMKGLAPNVFTYNCLIDGFCNCGDIEKGKELFDQMNEVGVSPNVITLNILVDGMCRHGRINGALNFFSGMQGNGLKGNAVTYATLITAYCDIDHIVKAVDLFDQMLASGCSPDASVYHRLISGLCKAGRMDAASNVLSKLKKAGFRPDIVCYNSLVRGFCKKNMVDKAYDIIKEREEAGVKPDSVSYTSLIAYFCQNGNFGLAREAMEWMINEGHVPTIATYGALIHAYCSNGNIKKQ
ncbi:hypothetical protein CXB51_019826 [Gossypium anomalum]|uniref:3-methyl-2-oxobutanoate hydroxymethyltransferase n=1 Tax=Gossypium anomalum TaxID=47600 RepID=A0A8J5YTS2_9ROSI|nr:hypothetical protein CXB51_019826 [Gossypium anomalum]